MPMNPKKASPKVFWLIAPPGKACPPGNPGNPEPEPDAEPPDAAAPTTRSEKRASLIVAGATVPGFRCLPPIPAVQEPSTRNEESRI